MNDELAQIKKSLRLIKAYALFVTALLMIICFFHCRRLPTTVRVDRGG